MRTSDHWVASVSDHIEPLVAKMDGFIRLSGNIESLHFRLADIAYADAGDRAEQLIPAAAGNTCGDAPQEMHLVAIVTAEILHMIEQTEPMPQATTGSGNADKLFHCGSRLSG
jgi:hypothetical protein